MMNLVEAPMVITPDNINIDITKEGTGGVSPSGDRAIPWAGTIFGERSEGCQDCACPVA